MNKLCITIHRFLHGIRYQEGNPLYPFWYCETQTSINGVSSSSATTRHNNHYQFIFKIINQNQKLQFVHTTTNNNNNLYITTTINNNQQQQQSTNSVFQFWWATSLQLRWSTITWRDISTVSNLFFFFVSFNFLVFRSELVSSYLISSSIKFNFEFDWKLFQIGEFQDQLLKWFSSRSVFVPNFSLHLVKTRC